MVLTKTHGIESVLLNHTRTRGPSVTRMRDFCEEFKCYSSSTEYIFSMSRKCACSPAGLKVFDQ